MPDIKTERGIVERIPFVSYEHSNGRFLSALSFRHNDQWVLYLDLGGRLLATDGFPAEGAYFASEAEQEHDLDLHFLNFTAQRACFLGLEKPIAGIRDDICNLGASVAKIKLLHDTKAQNKNGVCRMVTTEVEYIYSLCRSVYDLLQEFAMKLWEMANHPESNSQSEKKQRKHPKLDKSFAGMALKSNVPRTSADELVAKYSIPQEWAQFYVDHANFFAGIRQFRDNVVHNGSYAGSVFENEKGFLIQKGKKPFANLDLWRSDEIFANDLAPLLPAIGYMIMHTIDALENFTQMLERNFAFPEPLVPGMKLYMRGYYDQELATLLKDARARFLAASKTPVPVEG